LKHIKRHPAQNFHIKLSNNTSPITNWPSSHQEAHQKEPADGIGTTEINQSSSSLTATKTTHPVNSEVSEHTASSTRCHTAVLNLCGPGVGVHLRQLELGLGTGTARERGVADHVTERLAIIPENVRSRCRQLDAQMGAFPVAAGVSPQGRVSYRSGSVCSKAMRLLLSRIRRVLTNPERLSLLG